MNEKLKPCPFCGCEDFEIYRPSTTFGLVQISCTKCHAMVSFKGKYVFEYGVDKAWNRRDLEEQAESRIESLESWLKIAGTYACDCCVGCGYLGLNDDDADYCLENNGKHWVFGYGDNSPAYGVKAPNKEGKSNEVD